MRDIIAFLIAIAVSALDPIRLLGYLIAGSLIRNRWLAMTAGVVWMLAVQVIVVTSARMYQSSVPLMYTIAAIISAAFVTLLVHAIATKIRRSKQSVSSTDDEKK